MKTEIIKVDAGNPDIEVIRYAAEILNSGGLVAFPTETVYGLGADVFNETAVRKVFEVKNRPVDNPLIVHVSDYQQLADLSVNFPEVGKALTKEFWPGPLTLVIKCSQKIPKIVTGGLDTVAVRMPLNKVTLELIKCLRKPIVGPSANLSGRPSPTSAEHVFEDLSGKIELILDAGNTKIGLESTVIDITTQPPLVLRDGGLTREEIEMVIGDLTTTNSLEYKKRSPGTRYRHYAPKAKLIIIPRRDRSQFNIAFEQYKKENKKIGCITYSFDVEEEKSVIVRKTVNDLEVIGRELFRLLRELDWENVDIILVEAVQEVGLGKAIMDRLRKASNS